MVDPKSDLFLFAVPGIGMLLVSLLAIIVWRRVSGVALRYFWVGAGLRSIAVPLKFGFALLANQATIGSLQKAVRRPLFVTGAGLYLGLVSAAFELGLTWVAGRRWRLLGHDARRAIAVGMGAGAFESLLLAFVLLSAGLAVAAGEADTEQVRTELLASAVATPLFWLALPAERVIALLGYASTRALLLLGITHGRPWMGYCGFAMFVLVDGIVGAFHVLQAFEGRSLWWFELAVLPINSIAAAVLVSYTRRIAQNVPHSRARSEGMR